MSGLALAFLKVAPVFPEPLSELCAPPQIYGKTRALIWSDFKKLYALLECVKFGKKIIFLSSSENMLDLYVVNPGKF